MLTMLNTNENPINSVFLRQIDSGFNFFHPQLYKKLIARQNKPKYVPWRGRPVQFAIR